jgi:hypothetical protein
MAYSTLNPPLLLARGLGTQTSTLAALLYSTAQTSNAAVRGGTGLWIYQSSDPSTTVVGTLSYFTNGLDLGMKNGDCIIVQSVSSGGSTANLLMGISALVTTNSTAGFGIATGTQLLSTQ